jgi:hypothetical protein
MFFGSVLDKPETVVVYESLQTIRFILSQQALWQIHLGSKRNSFTKVYILRPGTVTHACNPSYLGNQDQEDHGLRAAQAKMKVSNTLSQSISQAVTAHVYDPSYMGGLR